MTIRLQHSYLEMPVFIDLQTDASQQHNPEAGTQSADIPKIAP